MLRPSRRRSGPLLRLRGYTGSEMEILLAREMGFCFGVRRAVEMMEEATLETGPMVSLGSVVHNPQVVERLKDRGLDVIASVNQVDGRPVAITAHGVSESVVRELERKGASVVDTTCPIVTRSQQWAKRLLTPPTSSCATSPRSCRPSIEASTSMSRRR